jgi:general secretion pathway protein G
MKWVGNRQNGFTIVEIMIVVVIVAILAGLVLTAYRGVTDRGYNSRITTGVNAYIKAIQIYKARNGAYPTQTSCLGSGYPSNTCWTGTGGTRTVDGTFDTALATIVDVKPMLADTLLATGVGNNMRAGAVYTAASGTGPFTITYYLKGTNQTCPQGSVTAGGSVLTRCDFTFV